MTDAASTSRRVAVAAAIALIASAASARTPTPTDGPSPTNTVAPTVTATGTPPPPWPSVTVFPNPARSGQRVTLDATGSAGSAPHWSQTFGDVALPIEHADSFIATFVAPSVTQATPATVQFEMSTFGGNTFATVALTLVPADAIAVNVGSVRAVPGSSAQMEVTLDPLGLAVDSLHHEIGFAPEAAIADRGDGVPDCEPGPLADSGGFRFLPDGCLQTATCDAIAADIGAQYNPIVAGGVVYRCRVALTAAPADTCQHALTCAAGNATAAGGAPLALWCSDGMATSAFEPQDPVVSLHTEPAEPLLGDTVRLTFSVSGDGGIPHYSLAGAGPFLSGDLQQSGGPFGDVVFELHADCPGTAPLQLFINYETSGGCPGDPFPFYFRNASSPVFPLTIRDPAGPSVSGHVAATRACVGNAAGVTVTLEPLGRTMQIGRDGVFVFDAVPAGDYTLTVTPLCNASGCWREQPVHVESDQVVADLCPGEREGFCAGDCNDDGTVDIAELILSVAVALGEAPASRCAAADVDADGTVQVNDLITAVAAALEGCPPPIGATATETPIPPATIPPTPASTPTSCRAVVPIVGPVTSPTDANAQTIYLCGIYYASSLVSVTGPNGESVELYQPADCPLTCPDSRQQCAAANVALLPGVVNPIEVCQVPGIGCGPLPDLCVDVEIEQRPASDGWATP